MNYIEAINKFWTLNERHLFRANEIALFFYLMKKNNQVSWSKYFEQNNQQILFDLGFSFRTLQNARNRLKQAKILDFQTKNGSAITTYIFTFLFANEQPTFAKNAKVTAKVGAEVSAEVGVEVGVEVVPDFGKEYYNNTQISRIEELKREPKTETKTKTFTPQTPHGGFRECSEWEDVLDPSFVPVLRKWFDYKASRNEQYRNISAINTLFEYLKKLANNDPVVAMDIVNQSIANNWAGLFELKTQSNNANSRSSYQTAAERGGAALRGVAEKVLAKYRKM